MHWFERFKKHVKHLKVISLFSRVFFTCLHVSERCTQGKSRAWSNTAYCAFAVPLVPDFRREVEISVSDVPDLSFAMLEKLKSTLLDVQTKANSYVIQRDDLEGAPRALVEGVAKFRKVADIFPPLGAGVLGGGMGVGCGLGWPIKAAYGPPRAFCGVGIGVAVFGAGYGQGMAGKRFGRDRRADEAKANIVKMESVIVAACDRVAEFGRKVLGKDKVVVEETKIRERRWFRRGGGAFVSGFPVGGGRVDERFDSGRVKFSSRAVAVGRR